MSNAVGNFRPDIQGLRAVAVGLVVVYHAGVTQLSGGYIGVDVFFVISGFLITSHLLSSLEAGRLNFGQFYARRARRILPASVAVLVLTVGASLIWLPPLQRPQMLQDAIATALYVPNMLFAYRGTDYLAETIPSVFQHYWSLGIEEQFYLVWPAALALGFWVFRRSYRGLFVMTAGLVVLSFAVGLVFTEASPSWAFFSLPTRAWELGVGGLVAFLLRARWNWLNARPLGLLAWLGIGTLLVAAFTFTSTTPFPSYFAAVPVIATALIIIGGAPRSNWGLGWLLNRRPFQFIGEVSYSLYLVHWPLLVIPQAAIGWEDELPLGVTLALGLLSVPVAYLSWRFVEQPWRGAPILAKARPRRTLLAALVTSVAIVTFAAGALQVSAGAKLTSDRAVVASSALSPQPVGTSYVPTNVTPDLRAVSSDNPVLYENDCHRSYEDANADGCQFGDNEAAPMIALFGDSHAAQWFPALDALADAGQIRIDVNTKSACAAADVPTLHDGVPYRSCLQWREDVIDRLSEEKPDIVVVSNYSSEHLEELGEDGAEEWARGLEATLDRLPDSTRFVVIADTPSMEATPAICLSAHLENADACARDRDEAVDAIAAAADRQAVEAAGGEYVDLTDYLCDDTCPAVIGDHLVYRDAHHMTASFSELLAEPLQHELFAQ